jgi:hypothetical protein
MSLKEIEDIFGIKISTKKRELVYVYLKSIYINQQLRKGLTIYEVAEELTLTYHAVRHAKSREDVFLSIDDYVFLKEAYDKQDRVAFDKCVKIIKTRNKRISHQDRGVPLNSIKFKKLIKTDKIIEILRKFPKHRLWDVSMNVFTKEDYDTLTDLEKKVNGAI